MLGAMSMDFFGGDDLWDTMPMDRRNSIVGSFDVAAFPLDDSPVR